ncbi:MAG: PEP-CTERM sorting domain-containing protein [Rhizobacter sp.]|nr:PEP-CTERM sorting domain-containing protein [Rhizobacter sp.]
MKTLQSRLLHIAIGFLGALALPCAHANFSATDSSFGGRTLIQDSQTGLEWLKLDVTLGLSYESVTAQMDAGELFFGFSVASASQVNTLFQNGGVWAPLSAMTSAEALAAGASFADFFGGHDGGDSFVSEGMTNAAMGPFNSVHQSAGISYRPGTSVSSWDDAYHSGATANVGTWLMRPAVAPIPEPGTAGLMVLGLAAVGAVVRRRRGMAAAN